MMAARHLDSPVGQGWEPQGFVNYLAAGWRLGEAEAFIRYFRPIIHPGVVSEQPLSPPQTGIDALEKQFRQIFRILPGATATIRSWAAAQPNVYVEFELHAPARHRALDLRTCDRFTVSDGLITRRSVYFDSAVLLRFLGRHPSRWIAALTGS
jgi:ketosteroid isomerase-like protein